jgi:hypothetical protein
LRCSMRRYSKLNKTIAARDKPIDGILMGDGLQCDGDDGQEFGAGASSGMKCSIDWRRRNICLRNAPACALTVFTAKYKTYLPDNNHENESIERRCLDRKFCQHRKVTPKMVHARAAELAVIDGRFTYNVTISDLAQAKRELTGEPDIDPKDAVLDSAPESE